MCSAIKSNQAHLTLVVLDKASSMCGCRESYELSKVVGEAQKGRQGHFFAFREHHDHYG
jgi:hypothetical protein